MFGLGKIFDFRAAFGAQLEVFLVIRLHPNFIYGLFKTFYKGVLSE